MPDLGVCYYPEHWDPAVWADDAARMGAAGINLVRIGEFAWAQIEPSPGRLDFDWLDQAFEVLRTAGLQIVLGTPTATPPRWVLDKHPDMLAHDAQGRPRKFGSRRHYCFSHAGYRHEAKRIVEIIAKRYGRHPALYAWQTDNEYGCHDTVISYSPAARKAFQDWLGQKYQSVEALNRAWGLRFWSMEYAGFDQIDLPNQTVTEPAPAHMLDFRRFSSDQVNDFNQDQVKILRAHSGAPILHNYMGRVTEFDHWKLGHGMDIASWDSYPLGFLEDRVGAPEARKAAYARQGDPDFQAFHHDLYRAVGHGRMWVMEQQPGPVNWAPYNPSPLPGMVRLWTWEAIAHGAEVVSYFRWRQPRFAQEQLHTGLLRPDGADAPGMAEARQVAQDLTKAPDLTPKQAPVALIFDYDADWAWTVQPHGQGLSYFGLVFDAYRALRKLGLSVDIVSPDHAFDGYKLVLAPGLMHVSQGLAAKFSNPQQIVVLGPRTAAKDENLAIAQPLPPAVPALETQVVRVETLRPGLEVNLEGGGTFLHHFETLETNADVLRRTVDGLPAVVRSKTGNMVYLAGWPDRETMMDVLRPILQDASQEVYHLPDGVRIRDCGDQRFVFNYSSETRTFMSASLEPAGVLRLPMP